MTAANHPRHACSVDSAAEEMIQKQQARFEPTTVFWKAADFPVAPMRIQRVHEATKEGTSTVHDASGPLRLKRKSVNLMSNMSNV